MGERTGCGAAEHTVRVVRAKRFSPEAERCSALCSWKKGQGCKHTMKGVIMLGHVRETAVEQD